MFRLTEADLSAITNSRLANLVESALNKDMPGLVGAGPDSITHHDLIAAVAEVRDLLRPLGLETERVVVKYVYGSLLVGAPLHERVPMLLDALATPAIHRYQKEDALDRLVEQLLAAERGA